MSFNFGFNYCLKLIGFTAIWAFATNAFAIPAKQGLITYDQPDGTTISLYLHGDEFSHYYTSPDGYLLQSCDDGYFRYVEADNGTNFVSGVIARDPNLRDA